MLLSLFDGDFSFFHGTRAECCDRAYLAKDEKEEKNVYLCNIVYVFCGTSAYMMCYLFNHKSCD
jgi:hypothetical protein